VQHIFIYRGEKSIILPRTQRIKTSEQNGVIL
jgi:hypothetical protein